MARNYKQVPSGLSEIGRSSKMQAEMLSVGKRMSGNANAVGDSKYEASPAIVTAGWQNEKRAGARVHETEAHWRDWRDRVLLRVAEGMKVRAK